MLFNSLEFIFFFLPISFFIYFHLNKIRLIVAGKIWLVGCSLFFYGWWNISYLPLIGISIIINYIFGSSITKNINYTMKKRHLLIIGIIFNIGLLSYYKYANFFIHNINTSFDSSLPLLNIVLPLGISFFTFTQTAYLVDCYRGRVKEYDLLNYTLFVTFYPHLIAGPILHHSEMMPQFASIKNLLKNNKQIASGVFLFSIGLFKKVVIADTLAVWAVNGFDKAKILNLIEAWVTSLSFTFQLYFDFSGYTDMAIGAALLFNIKLPVNFNSPYKSMNIQEFWRRWHITLSRFLRDYIYIPLGGNKSGRFKIYFNLFLTFLLGGIWHGAGWTFIFWGVLHGIAMIMHRIWHNSGRVMQKNLSWLITFNFINITWIFFRAKDWDDALKVLKGMVGLSTIVLPERLAYVLPDILITTFNFTFKSWAENINGSMDTILILFLCFFITIFCKNSMEMKNKFHPSKYYLMFSISLTLLSLSLLNRISEFLYFNF